MFKDKLSFEWKMLPPKEESGTYRQVLITQHLLLCAVMTEIAIIARSL